ncbi:efflux RND transporter periplasmic adaptor subunit [Motilimonas pumila]|uniref:Efflux RND transporter periplasmic adaptor subunit n=1 Tax=Motilimonas pumila TaxID=2303987 RepID=A0A418YKL6_9GAMM|nr:efflux RND transporter periplasmic adaptor subunit [Motilimonas pumila]RJG51507.1 efflux RND transporter periplasmic adaptor subunit [Motilimonas pumila]
MKKWYVFSVLLCVLLFGSVFGFHLFKQQKIAEFMAQRELPALPVEVTQINPQSWTPQIPAIGFIEPYQGVTVATQVSGIVDKIHFASGDTIEQGQLLLELETKVEKANLAAAEAKLPAISNTLKRTRSLYQQGSVSKGALDEAESNFSSLKAEILALKATIERREIRAPFDGVIGIRQVNLGQYLQSGDEIARLENLDRMLIRFIVPQKELAKLTIGATIDITTDAYPERAFEGAISAIEPTVDIDSGVIQLQAEIPNADQLLRSGMYAELNVRQPELVNQVVIPLRAISFSLYGESVYVVETLPAEGDEDDETQYQVRQKTIKVAERRGDYALVASGVTAGETLVTAGQVRLQNGAKVKIVEDSFINNNAEFSRD